jgi:mono/diheme cytochrome c family protein
MLSGIPSKRILPIMKNSIIRPRLVLFVLLLMLVPAIATSAPLMGENLFKALGCRGCHLVGGSGGSLGPALDGLDERFDSEALRRILTLSREGSVMPSYVHLTEPELAALLDYLLSL